MPKNLGGLEFFARKIGLGPPIDKKQALDAQKRALEAINQPPASAQDIHNALENAYKKVDKKLGIR